MPLTEVHPSWVKVGGLPLEIMEGKHDEMLTTIRDACNKRLKSMFRKGQRCKLTGTRSVDLDGKECTILKVNQKSITIGVGKPEMQYGIQTYPDGEYNVPPTMLVAI